MATHSPSVNTNAKPTFRHELWALLVLAGLQFSHNVDFMIMMPLGPKLMRDMNINSQDFGALVSVYTFTAGITNLLGAFLLDRYDRKKSTLILFFGFLVGTIACGFANSYGLLFAARSLAGAFGGLMNAATLAIVGDYIPYERRARAMGIVMSSFSVASIAGVPLGLWLANIYNWQAPFFFVAIVGVILAAIFWYIIPPLRRHIAEGEATRTVAQSFEMIGSILKQGGPQRALALIAVMMLSQFAIIPFLTAFYVFNVKFPEENIPLIYLTGGALTIITSPLVGRLADAYGRTKIFVIFLALACVPILTITHLPSGAPVWFVLAISGLFFIASNGRFVPAMTMITAVVPAQRRGTFMSLVSCVQQVSVGVAAYWAGIAITENPQTHELQGYGAVGIASVLMNIAVLYLGLGLERKAHAEPGTNETASVIH